MKMFATVLFLIVAAHGAAAEEVDAWDDELDLVDLQENLPAPRNLATRRGGSVGGSTTTAPPTPPPTPLPKCPKGCPTGATGRKNRGAPAAKCDETTKNICVCAQAGFGFDAARGKCEKLKCPRVCAEGPDAECSVRTANVCACKKGFEKQCKASKCKCTCPPNRHGKDCSGISCPESSGAACGGAARGVCSRSNKCLCKGAHTGTACQEVRATCKTGGSANKECSGKGRCVAGACVCVSPASGEACEVDGKCPRGSTGRKNMCSGKGRCVGNKCTCAAGYGGDDCSQSEACAALSNCSGNGLCQTRGTAAVCACKTGFMGKDCASARACPTGNKVGGKAVACSGNGACDMGSFTCKCKPGSSGADCSITRVCADPLCSGNGTCDRGACKCKKGFQGVSCESKESASCPKNRGKECSGAGKCFFGKCICPVSRTGNACETQAASKCKADAQGKECSGNGTCDGARCVCTSGYENGLRGICEVAKKRSCPSGGAANKACADQGKCDKRTLQCRCDKGFSGDNCATADATCPDVGGKVCNGVGKCTGGRCTCPRSHSGDACETEATCPSAAGAVCSGASKGICDSRTKTCTCAGLNSGSACDAVRTCSTNSTGSVCSARGTCDAKVYKGRGQGQEFSKLTCKCGDGFTGNACETAERQCPTDTAGQQCGGRDGGNCDKKSGACLCKFGRSGADCSTRPVVVGCPSDCNGLGECKTFTSRAYNATSRAFAFKSIGYCKCSKGTFGRACESSLQGCPSTDAGECNGKGSGKCNEYTGACKCRDGWSGDACNMAAAAVPCPANANGTECSAAGACNKDGTCKCTARFTGIACATALKSCPLGARKISGRGKSPKEVECSGFGTCDRATGACTCRSGYSGDACGAKKTCAAPCQNGGKCDSHRGKCLCRNGFKGDVCALACPKDSKNQVCGGRGRCGEDGTCNCRTGFTGAVCGDVSCPANSTGSVCSGQGDCSFSALSGRPRCTCKSGFKGYRCELDAAQHAAKTDDLRAKVDAAIAAAGQQEQELATCTDEDKPFLCPNVPVVSALLRGTCQASRRACSSTSEKAKCKTAGKRWCGVSCISKKLRCPKTRRCKRGKTRCLDGSCAASLARCSTDTTGLCDVAGEVPCGDGVTCAADAKACRALVQLDGCPIGQVSCASNPKECRASADECSCPVAGESFCGWQRNEKGRMLRIGSVGADGESKLVKVPICGATCGGKANPLTADLKPTPMAADPLEDVDQPLVATDGNGTAASLGAIKIPKGAVTSEDGEVVTFSIKPAALGDVLGGSLKDLEAASTALTLIPDRVVDIDGDIGIEIDLCVGGPEAQANGTLCDAVLARLRPYSSQDLTADDATELPGGCQKGSAACGCSCAFTTPHLTTFVVAEGDVAVAGELSADQLDAGVADLVEVAFVEVATTTPAPSAPDQGGGAAFPLVPVAVGAAVVVALLALVKSKKNGRGGGGASPKEFDQSPDAIALQGGNVAAHPQSLL